MPLSQIPLLQADNLAFPDIATAQRERDGLVAVGGDLSTARMLAAYRQGPAGIVAPIYQGRRGNPVLFDRRHFAGLLALPAGAAPRDLLQKHPADMQLVAVDSDAILADIDRPEDYERLRPGHTPAYE